MRKWTNSEVKICSVANRDKKKINKKVIHNRLLQPRELSPSKGLITEPPLVTPDNCTATLGLVSCLYGTTLFIKSGQIIEPINSQ